MESQIWVVSTLLISIVLIVLTIVKLKFHPFLALLLASFFVGAMMGMGPLEMVNAIESGIGGTLGFLAAVIGLGTILGKMMEVSGAAERIGLTLQRCRWLSADVIMVLVGLICGITLFVEVGVVLLIPLACNMFGIPNEIAMQVVAVGFIIGVLQDSCETALNSSTDVLFTAAACQAEDARLAKNALRS